ncbi:MAG: ABC transporter [Actinobacteria bacterium HGW-Actinobacteria-8]|nr:MAG: ABC transporter [Actinobacteria bacterium HGW-Actinobacteria-8]
MSATTSTAGPSWLDMTGSRFVVDIKEFVRSREQMIFIFAFPMIFLVLFGSVFSGQELGNSGVTFPQYFMAGMIASGILNTGFQSLAISISIDRQEDVLKRVFATPLPATSFFAAKILQMLIVSIIQIAILVALGVVLYGVELPTEGSTWLTFAWVFLLGTGASTTVGIAMSSLLRNGKAASAILTPIVLVLQFTSGVFLVFTELPTFLQRFAEIFPLKWLAQGMRSVFLPESFQAAEVRGSWEHPTAALVMTIWLIVGLVIAVRTFRWMRHDDN